MMLDFYSHHAIMEKPTSIVGVLEGSNLNRSLRGATAMAKSKRTANHQEVKRGKSKGPNHIIMEGPITYIILEDRNGSEKARAIIDTKNLERVMKYRWSLSSSNRNPIFYAHARLTRTQWLYLHHLIFGDKELDHKNRNPLDNREDNLRKATRSQNQANKFSNPKSGYRGVYQESTNGVLREWYQAMIKHRQSRTHIGRFKTPEEAARAYDAAAIRLHGEYATLNFPQPSQGEQP